MNILDKVISVYDGVKDTQGITIDLGTFLLSEKYIGRIKELRACEDEARRKAIKLSLPQATISGVFQPTRKAENLKAHSGLICVDIDAKDNPQITDIRETKKALTRYSNIAYMSLSVSGQGLFVIIPVAYPEKHKEHFQGLQRDFAKIGIKIDNACSDITRLRCISFDEEAYCNEEAKRYTYTYKEPRKPIICDYRECSEEDVEKLVKEIEIHGTDLTQGYQQWYQVGASLASLGERGRSLFHRVSAINSDYRYDDTDKKFTELLRHTSRITIGTFFHLCREQGILLRK